MELTDQLGRKVVLPGPARRIVSLVPSQTELLASLGLEDEVVGITKFCERPRAWYRSKVRIGGTKQVRPDLIRELQPDLILANKEENVREQVEELSDEFPVWVSDIPGLPAALGMIDAVGRLCGREARARELVQRIQRAFSSWLTESSGAVRPSAVYLIWREPYMAAGGDTFIHDMLHRAGFVNALADAARYPTLTAAQLRELSPDVLLLSSEPYPFSDKHQDEFSDLCPQAVIMPVDGQIFSWYGSRLQYAPAYFRKLHERLEKQRRFSA